MATLSGGSFLAAWRDGNNFIAAKKFNPDGTKFGAAFQVNGSAVNQKTDPSVTGLTDGSFVITWGEGTIVKAQIFSADGLKIGVEFPVISAQLSSAGQEVTALTNGRFVVVIEGIESGGNTGRDIYTQIFNSMEVRTIVAPS